MQITRLTWTSFSSFKKIPLLYFFSWVVKFYVLDIGMLNGFSFCYEIWCGCGLVLLSLFSGTSHLFSQVS